MEAINDSWIEVGVASLALPGQAESGDLHVFKAFPGGALVGVIDGLGHGSEAAVAARTAVEILESRPSESVLALIRQCHDKLNPTRGAAMSLASLNRIEGTLTWLGVGNVEGVLLRGDKSATPGYESLLLRGGTVGRRLPSLFASILPVSPGDTLIFATDGIHSDFAQGLAIVEPPPRAAARILSQHGKGTDDALVLVARVSGAGS